MHAFWLGWGSMLGLACSAYVRHKEYSIDTTCCCATHRHTRRAGDRRRVCEQQQHQRRSLEWSHPNLLGCVQFPRWMGLCDVCVCARACRLGGSDINRFVLSRVPKVDACTKPHPFECWTNEPPVRDECLGVATVDAGSHRLANRSCAERGIMIHS